MKRQGKELNQPDTKKKINLISQTYKSKPCEYHIKGRCTKGS